MLGQMISEGLSVLISLGCCDFFFAKALKKLDYYLGDFWAVFSVDICSKFLTPVFMPGWKGAIIYLQKGTLTLEQISEE